LRAHHAVMQATTFVNFASKLVTAALQRKRNPGTAFFLRSGVELGGERTFTDENEKGRRSAGPFSRHSALDKLAIGALVSIRGEQPCALI
jgi:hypothetical protein